jgi:hypothetical protein
MKIVARGRDLIGSIADATLDHSGRVRGREITFLGYADQ